MVTRIQQVIREGFVDVTGRLGEGGRRQLPSGARGVIKLRPGVTLGQIPRSQFERGQFSSDLVLNPLTVITRPGKTFERRLPTGVGGAPLTSASLRALVSRGDITRQEASQIARTQRITRLARARERIVRVKRIRAPVAVKRAPVTLKGFGAVFAPQALSSQQLNTFSSKIEREGKLLDRRITAKVATQAEVSKFNRIVIAFNNKVSTAEAREVRRVPKEVIRAPGVGVVRIPRIEQEIIKGDITAADVFPKGVSIGSVVGRGVSIPEAQKRVADFLENTLDFGPRAEKIPIEIRRKRIGTLRTIGSAIGTVFAGFEIVGTAVALGGQEIAKGRTSDIAQRVFGPTRQKVQWVFTGGVAKFIKENQDRDLLVITNPLKAIKVTGNTAIITPSAVGRAGEAVFDIAIITGLGKTSKIVALSKAKKPIGIIGKLGRVKKGATAKVLKKLKVKDVRKLVGSITRPVKVSKEARLLKDIAKIQKNLRARKLRVGRPSKLKKLQSQVLDLREKFRAKDIFKPVPKGIRAAQREINVLKKIGKKLKPIKKVKVTAPTGIVRKAKRIGGRQRSRIRILELERKVIDIRTRVKPKTVFKKVPRTEKGLRLEIRKLESLEKARFARVRVKVRLPTLQDKVLRLRERVRPKTIFKPVPKTIKSALKEIKELEDFERIGRGLARGKIRVSNLQEQVLRLRQDFRPASILKPIPKTERALLKEITGLNRIRAGRGFRFRKKVRVKALEEQLRLLKEKALITRRTKRLSFAQKSRVNVINSKVKSLQTQIAKTRPKLKPKKVIKPKARAIQVQKKRTVKVSKKKRRFIRLVPRQVSRLVSLPQQVAFVRGFTQILIAPRSQILGLTNQSVRKLVRGLPAQATLLRLRPGEVSRIKQTLTPKQKIKLRGAVLSLTKQEAKLAVKAITTPALKAKQALKAAQRLRQITKAVTKTKPKIKKKVKVKRIKRPLPPPVPIPGLEPVTVENIARRKGPFNVIVRSRGKKVRVNKVGLNGKQALALGGRFADNNAVRSFTIVKTTGKIKKIKVPRFNRNKFRRPMGNTKLERFFLVEKTQFAIDTRGEKQQISRKGAGAPRRKKRKRRRLIRIRGRA